MDRNTLAEWMKSESLKVHDLANQLREHIITIPTGSRTAWLEELCKRFDHFTAHVRRMMSIEEEDGYLLPVVEVRPSLSKQVEMLRREHDELRELTDDLSKRVKSLKADHNLLLRDTCTRLQIYMGHVQRHEEHENHMVLYTLTQDIGGKD
jgi:hemerythrin-like domain-containing protein